MQIVERGSGTPLVIVPGLQGRWEYFAPAVEALAESFRVMTFSLCGELGCPRIEPSRGIDNFSDQIAAALDSRGLERAIVCGVSFGGLAALRFAAERPERTAALVLVSTPGPGFHLKKRHRLYARLPWVFAPVFLAETPRRLRREVVVAIPGRRARLRFAARQMQTIVRAPVMLGRMAKRAELIATVDFAREASRIVVPTLVVSGEPGLDHVVAPHTTSAYVEMIPGARGVTLDRTGHLGVVTRPGQFAELVNEFARSIRRQDHAACDSRSRGQPRVPARRAGRRARRQRRRAGGKRAHGGSGPRRGRVRAPASPIRRHDAHEGRLSGGQSAVAHRMFGASLQ